MATYYEGTGAAGSERPDLGHVASRYAAEYGLGENSRYVALRAFSTLPVGGNGAIRVAGKSAFFHPDGDNKTFIRGVGASAPVASASTFSTVNINLADYGMAEVWDEADPYIMGLMEMGGLAAVEQHVVAKSTARCLEGLDRQAAAILTDSTSPFTGAADVDASSAKWSTASNDIPAQLATAMINADTEFDSILMSQKALTYYRINQKVASAQFATPGLGALTDDQVLSSLGAFGISQLFVGDTSIFGNTVVLYKRGDGNPMIDPTAVVVAIKSGEDTTEEGLTIRTKDVDFRTHSAYVFAQADVKVAEVNSGCRIMTVY